MKKYGPGTHAEQEVMQLDTLRHVDIYLETLKQPLRETSIELNGMGFPLDEEGRINPAAFSDLLAAQELGADLLKVKERELAWRQKLEVQRKKLPETEFLRYLEEEERNKKISQLMEVSTTIAFNKFWFNGKFIAVRAARYDDNENNVDTVVFDKESGTPLAMMDATTDPKKKTNLLYRKIQDGGAIIKYMTTFNQGKAGLKKSSEQDRLPWFMLVLDHEEIIQLAQGCTQAEPTEATKKLQDKVFKQLVEQCSLYAQFKFISSNLKNKYLYAAQIIEKAKS